MTHLRAHPSRHGRWLRPLAPRSREEEHRVSTPLELLFDLVIVVAIAEAGRGLHHALVEGHVGQALLGYSMTFFAIWWAWVNFTWFASAYDNDDVGYRLLVFVQLTGALVFAAGIPGFQHGARTVVVAGYVIMRLALAAQWSRVAKADPPRRPTALRYTIGVLGLQALWVAHLFVPPALVMPGFWILGVAELLVPAWAEQVAPTPWHAHHIAERYGLFTIIALGESIFSASVAVQQATEAGALATALLPIIVGGLLVIFSCWWLYFDHPGHESLTSVRAAFAFGYGHYFVFASAAGIGAGLVVAVDHATHHAEISARLAGGAVAVPAAIYLSSLWLLHVRSATTNAGRFVTPLVVIAILLTPLTGHAVLATGALMAGLTVFKIATR